ncbi:CapA family protein [Mycobacterium sp.]
MANNHILDFGRCGLADTLDALVSAGIYVSGREPTCRSHTTRRW